MFRCISCRHSPHHKACYPSEVQANFCDTFRGIFARRHITMTCYAKIRTDSIGITPQDYAPGLLCGIVSKCWLFTRVSHAHICSHLHKRTRMVENPHADTETVQCMSTRTSVYCRIDRSSSVLSLSHSRRILVRVNLYFRRKTRQSSKVGSPPV